MVRSIDCRTRHRTSAALLTQCSSFFLAKKWHAATSSLRETVFVRNSNKQFSAVSRHLESITCRNLQISYFAVAVTSPALRCRRRRAAAILSPVAFLPRQVCGNCECIMPLNIPIFPSFKKRRAKGVFFLDDLNGFFNSENFCRMGNAFFIREVFKSIPARRIAPFSG